MAKHKRNVLIAGILSLVTIIIASPLDDFLYASVLSHLVLGFSWIHSLILGAVIGSAVFITLEYFGEGT
jgi:NhaP-type Na+/H+ and K+/H+ antiporter